MPNDYEDNDTAVGVNLRRLRLKAQLTQQQLAERIGWQRVAIAQAETGKRRFRIDDLAVLCKGLGVSYRALLVGQDETLHDLDPHRRGMQNLMVKALGDGSDEEPMVAATTTASTHSLRQLAAWLNTTAEVRSDPSPWTAAMLASGALAQPRREDDADE